ncbi:MAG TPA: maltose alpha-D-glucosyltransferase [Acidobacteriota bacterium]|nr:maltose alpha-D-glucosyltransferase [Acidobacteriota bacterium]
MKRLNVQQTTLEDDPLWYKSAIIYELHVRSFFDSNRDGIGDFQGLTQKLDYLQELGVTALWLLPFYPSPWRDDGYDIADYRSIHPAYGSLNDFRKFLKEARGRGLRVVTELVINHTSDQHPWFQKARRSPPDSPARNFYVWSDTPDRYGDTRIIFQDFEHSNWAWDPTARQYYWHRFYSHQPDLNFDNPAVHRAIFQVVDYWLKMGVDGMRLDAVPYLFEREGTNCENLPETHEFLKTLRSHVDSRFQNRLLLSEANQWPEDAVSYFGDGDESHMNFHFPLMPRLFMSIRLEDRFPIIDILEQTPEIPEVCQWALFLRNHDELTLEMVTEEERDYMYRVYAGDLKARINLGIRRRLAPLLGNNRRKIELMNGLLFSLPGTPVLYYGDEIGMGDNIYLGDRNGVRTPMQWSGDRNAGFSRANPQQLFLPAIIDPEYHYESINVETQANNPSSLLWWMKRLMHMRKRLKAFGHGSLEFLHPDNRKVLAYIREHEDQSILVVANLSRFAQSVELDLARFRGCVPLELFGRNPFPAIGELPYFVTLGPHSFYWFQLEPRESRQERVEISSRFAHLPVLQVRSNWREVLKGGNLRLLEEKILPEFLPVCRWFGSKARDVRSVHLVEAIAVHARPEALTILEVEYLDGDPDFYLLPLAAASDARADEIRREYPTTVLCELRFSSDGKAGILYDAIVESEFCRALLRAVVRKESWAGPAGKLTGVATGAIHALLKEAEGKLAPAGIGAEQSNSSVVFGQKLILKMFRRLDRGMNPDVEVALFLNEKGFENTPATAGYLQYVGTDQQPVTLGHLQEFILNEGDAWRYTLDALARYYERILAQPLESVTPQPSSATRLLELASSEIPDDVSVKVGSYLESARLLGKRTAEMHLALASDSERPAFAPEAFNSFSRRSLYQSMRNQAGQVFLSLGGRLDRVPESIRPRAEKVLSKRDQVTAEFRRIIESRIQAARTRCHGDFHLGQVLVTGKDFIIIDFEGEPSRSISERRIKRTPFRDVAGMLRSFQYAADTALFRQVESGLIPIRRLELFEPWARYWQLWVSVAFLKSYLEAAESARFAPENTEDLAVLLNALLLEKAIYELGYELNHRPDWLQIPLQGILNLLEES